jgi:uncharacterized protein GlcG (DUF336 family)
MLTLKAAQFLVGKAMDMATAQFGRPICVALVDPQGFLLAFARMEGAPVRSIAISQGKAYSAARLGVDTEAFLERLRRENIEASYFCDERLTALPGGCVLKNTSGALVGAVGISGLAAAEDHVIGQMLAGLTAKAELS